MIRAQLVVGIAGTMLFVSAFSARAEDSQVELMGEWVLISETDPIFDTENVAAVLSEGSDDDKSIMFRCREGQLSAYIVWGRFAPLGASFESEPQPLIVRFDSLDPRSETWPRSTNDTATFAPDPIEFMREAASHERLAVRTSGRRGASLTGVFDLQETRAVVAKVGLACDIPESTW